MSIQDRLDEEVAAQQERGFVNPNFKEGADIDFEPPITIRNYGNLMEVIPSRLNEAKGMTDDNESVVLPIGGIVMPGPTDGSGFLFDDLVVVPQNSILSGHGTDVQVPIMVKTKPPYAHDAEAENYVGTLPTMEDLMESIRNTAKETEMVLAIQASNFVDAILRPMVDPDEDEEDFVAKSMYHRLSFVRRDWCEKDERYMQLLPYVVFYKKVNGKFQLFVYQRGKGVGEERLAGGCSIGIGGHINPHDMLSLESKFESTSIGEFNLSGTTPTGRVLVNGFWTTILGNVIREGSEEIVIKIGGEVTHIADVIEKQASEDKMHLEEWLHNRTAFFSDYAAGQVERVHLGMFIGIELPADAEITTNEESLIDVGFVDLQELANGAPWTLPSDLECWTKSIVASLSDTLKYSEQNLEIVGYRSDFALKSGMINGFHPNGPEVIAKIPQEDRWKIGTLSQIFSPALKFYALNAFIRS